jgi:hypothetical protein
MARTSTQIRVKPRNAQQTWDYEWCGERVEAMMLFFALFSLVVFVFPPFVNESRSPFWTVSSNAKRRMPNLRLIPELNLRAWLKIWIGILGSWAKIKILKSRLICWDCNWKIWIQFLGFWTIKEIESWIN